MAMLRAVDGTRRGMGQMPVIPQSVWVPKTEDPYKEYPSWCDSWLLSRVFGLFSDACIPQSEESIQQAGLSEVEIMCRKVARQGEQTYEECMERASLNEDLFRAQLEAASRSSREHDPETYCEYKASQEHPTLFKLFGGGVACKYQELAQDIAEGKYDLWILVGAAALVLLVTRK